MAIYKVQGPDGVEHQLEGPDGATDEQILSVAQSQFGGPTPKVELPANDPKTGIVPAEEQAKFTPQQAFEYDKGGWDAGATEPEEMRALRHVNEVGAGVGAGQLAVGGAVGLAGMAANAKKVGGIRNALAGWFEKKAAEQAAKAGGAGSAATEELGSEGVRDYGRMLQEKKIVAPWRSPEEMNKLVQPQLNEAGAQVGKYRDIGDYRSMAQGAERPTTLNIEQEIQQNLGPKYNTGLASGEKGQVDNALEELRKLSPVEHSTTGAEVGQTMENVGGGAEDAYTAARRVQEGANPEMAQGFDYLHDKPTFSELFDKSTAMNNAAKGAKAIQQPSGALTDTANILAKKSTEGLEGFLDPAEAAGYKVAKKDWGDLSLADQLTSGGEAKAFANTSSLPVSKFGALSRVLNSIAPHSAIMGLNKKVEAILRVQPQAFGNYAKVLGDAVKRGGSALASTMFVLQQQDPQFQDTIKELNENGGQ